MTAILSSFSRESVSSWFFKAAISDLRSAMVDDDSWLPCAVLFLSRSVSSLLILLLVLLNGVVLPLPSSCFGVALALSGSS